MSDAIEALGVMLVVAAAWMVAVPLGMFVAGVALVAAGNALEGRQ